MTYKIDIPANPADSGITTLEATDTNGKVRTLVWRTDADSSKNAWFPLSLVSGQPTKVGLPWRSVLETFDNVREPADPVREARTEIADELQSLANSINSNSEDLDTANRDLASVVDDIRAIVTRLRK